MKELKHPLLANSPTRIFHENEEDMEFNAPHYFKVYADKDYPKPIQVGEVNFQCGPIKENGVNGVTNEDLIVMAMARLVHFNKGDFRCKENSMAITKLEEALLWLNRRTVVRQQRGVEGTNKK